LELKEYTYSVIPAVPASISTPTFWGNIYPSDKIETNLFNPFKIVLNS